MGHRKQLNRRNTIFKEMKKIKKINLHRLLKLELPNLALKVIEVIEKNEPESLKIKEAFDLLLQQQPQIEILKRQYSKHEITSELEALRMKRATYSALIAINMRSISRSKVMGDDTEVTATWIVVDFYLTNLRSFNDEIIQVKLSEFFREIDEREEIETTLSTMGLTSYLNELRNVHSSINEQLTKRKTSIAARPDVNIPPIVKSVRTAMRNMFAHINFAKTQNTELDYSKLVSELNQEIVVYSSLISNRATIRAKMKAEAENDNSGGDDVVVDEGTHEAQSSRETIESTELMVQRSEEEVEEKKGLDITPLNSEKTAAKSSKHLQPPFMNSEE